MKNLKVSIDSGAYSLYNTQFAPSKRGLQSDRDKADYSYYKTKEFKEYLEDYIEFLHKHHDDISMYVCVDIIYNPKASWEIQQYMESCGLLPVPVFHFGEDWKYLERYLDNYEYVGIGGLGQKATVKSYIDFGDEVFKRVCDKHGTPKNKLHGFAMTSAQLMKRYPWYSCDSSSWDFQARHGWARFPKLDKNGNYLWLDKPAAYRFTERSRFARVHIDKQPDIYKKQINSYVNKAFGFSIDKLWDYEGRTINNIGHTLQIGVALKKHYKDNFNFDGGNIYLAGHGLLMKNVRSFKRYFSLGSRPIDKNIDRNYLSSFFYKKTSEISLNALKPTVRRKLDGV